MISTSKSNTENRTAFLRLNALDPILLGCAVILICFGLAALNSIGPLAKDPGAFKKQLLLLAMGVVPFLVFWLTPANIWQKASKWLYGVNVVLLALVLKGGTVRGGAERWLDIGPIQFQPSELTKILIVLTLSTLFAKHKDEERDGFTTLITSMVHVAVPALLIAAQPHLGATLSVLLAWLIICVINKISWKHMLIALVLVAVAGGTSIAVNDYQRGRVEALFAKEKDEKGDHFQQDRSMISIGSGGPTGKGYLKGDFKGQRYVPEQHNDFIFSLIGQEFGFVGSAFLMLVYVGFFLRGWFLALRMEDTFSRSVMFGLLTILGFHWIVNISMNLGIGPVVGLWLPFISYGGTSMWLCLACLGIMLNLSANTQESMFGRNAPQAWLED